MKGVRSYTASHAAGALSLPSLFVVQYLASHAKDSGGIPCATGPVSYRVPTVMENPGKICFPGKSWKTCKKLKVTEKKFKSQKILPTNFLKIIPLF